MKFRNHTPPIHLKLIKNKIDENLMIKRHNLIFTKIFHKKAVKILYDIFVSDLRLNALFINRESSEKKF
ncbi:hypothetical protein M2347_002739 [Chryseobacterium sp. H1D6B]|nr:hypothetical protein [Chryseobacterium sp. H1D6B]